MDQITNEMLWTIIAPLAGLQFLLAIIALVACARAESIRGPKWMWVLIILFVNLLGPIAFFVAGRRNE